MELYRQTSMSKKHQKKTGLEDKLVVCSQEFQSHSCLFKFPIPLSNVQMHK